MIVVSVTYPAASGTHFDLEYYRTKHVPLVQSLWGPCGLTAAEYMHGTGAPPPPHRPHAVARTGAPGGGTAAYFLVALLSFETKDAFENAGKQHGREIMGDVRNFTDVKPVVQFNEALQVATAPQ